MKSLTFSDIGWIDIPASSFFFMERKKHTTHQRWNALGLKKNTAALGSRFFFRPLRVKHTTRRSQSPPPLRVGQFDGTVVFVASRSTPVVIPDERHDSVKVGVHPRDNLQHLHANGVGIAVREVEPARDGGISEDVFVGSGDVVEHPHPEVRVP